MGEEEEEEAEEEEEEEMSQTRMENAWLGIPNI